MAYTIAASPSPRTILASNGADVVLARHDVRFVCGREGGVIAGCCREVQNGLLGVLRDRHLSPGGDDPQRRAREVRRGRDSRRISYRVPRWRGWLVAKATIDRRPGPRRPAPAGSMMSADRKTSAGAPCSICVRSADDDPVETARSWLGAAITSRPILRGTPSNGGGGEAGHRHRGKQPHAGGTATTTVRADAASDGVGSPALRLAAESRRSRWSP